MIKVDEISFGLHLGSPVINVRLNGGPKWGNVRGHTHIYELKIPRNLDQFIAKLKRFTSYMETERAKLLVRSK